MPVGMPVLQISPLDTPVPVSQLEVVQPALVLRKRYNNPISDFMLNALLKKE